MEEVATSYSDANKLSAAKFSNLGTIMGAANWVQILNDFVTRTLKEDTPDMAAVFHALELQSKLNVHGVIDGAAKLQGAAIWEKRTELLQVANIPANLLTRLCALRPVGPGPFQGQLLTLAREAATERKESKDLRDITDTSTLLSAVRGLKGNTFNKKPFVPKKNFPKKGNQKTYSKPQGDRRQVYFQEGAFQ
jgi:hypothetical protein